MSSLDPMLCYAIRFDPPISIVYSISKVEQACKSPLWSKSLCAKGGPYKRLLFPIERYSNCCCCCLPNVFVDIVVVGLLVHNVFPN